jgi:hypothetical protein
MLRLLAQGDTVTTNPESETVYLDNCDGTGWRVDPDGWSHPLVATADGWQETGGTPQPPDPNPHPVTIDCEATPASPRYAPHPDYQSTTTMNMPHGYEGWPTSPAELAGMVREAAESLHFIFTYWPPMANQAACLENTLDLLANVATGVEQLPDWPPVNQPGSGVIP